MRLKKNYLFVALFACATLGFVACGDDYDDTAIKNELADHESRISALEEWQKTVNSNITALQGAITALENKDFVTDVKQLSDGTGYTISFQNSGSITIKNGVDGEDGADGATPLIGVKQDTDGVYYWTLNGEYITVDGQKMPVTGAKGDKGDKGDKGETGETGATGATGAAGKDAVAPQVRINEDTNMWEISTDGGTTWTSTGVQATGDKGETGATGATGAQGDAIFAKDGIDTSNEEYVELTLADGKTKIRLQRYQEVQISFSDGSFDTFFCSSTDNELGIVLPSDMKQSDYTALMATITSATGFAADIVTRAGDTSGWTVKLTKPVFTNDSITQNAKVKISHPDVKTDYKAILKVTLIDKKGKEYSTSRVVCFRATTVVENPNGNLSTMLPNLSTVKELTITGTLTDADFTYIKNNWSSLELLDLSHADITSIPNWGLSLDDGNEVLETIILPESLTSLGKSAVRNCYNLQHINLPSGLKEIGPYCFEGTAITSITIPESVETAGEGAFYACESLTTAQIDADLTEIPEMMFVYCSKLTTVNLPESITKIGDDAFTSCALQVDGGVLVIPSNVKSIGERAFSLSTSKTNITSVSFPEGLEEIGNDAFTNTKGIKEVTLPASLKKMGDAVFAWSSYYTGYVEKITFKGTTPPEITYSYDYDGNLSAPSVDKMQTCKVYVPSDAIRRI